MRWKVALRDSGGDHLQNSRRDIPSIYVLLALPATIYSQTKAKILEADAP